MAQKTNHYPWLELYKAQTAKKTTPKTPLKPVGRPSRKFHSKKSTVWLTSLDRKAIEELKGLFEQYTEKKVSLGTTFGLLAHIFQERANQIDLEAIQSMDDLISKMIG